MRRPLRTRDETSSRARPLSAEQPATLVVGVPPARSRSEPSFDVPEPAAPAAQPEQSSFSLGRCFGALSAFSSGLRAPVLRQSSDPQPSASPRPAVWRQASEPAYEASPGARRQVSDPISPDDTPVAIAIRRQSTSPSTPAVRRQVSDPVVPTSPATPPIRRQVSDPVPSPVSILRQPSGPGTPRRPPSEHTRVTITVPVETHAPPRSPQRPSLARAFKEELRTSSL
ncbi:hypothetical protein ONE63_003897 [Megalurothrips usitatus]|uniref:Uncharacterized protein n=1 Tax=Megalurothrips usitatus TaxID=439358 RepID=A0AAV7XB17_9NEOP|nr:hypothetical protein ONE63_003897 [Megalurothrips usitatus]